LEVAVHVWGLVHHPHSQNLEWASWITRNRRTSQYSFYGTLSGEYNNVQMRDIETVHTVIGTIHSHPATGSNYFSYDDAAGIFGTDRPGFLVTPLGHIYRMSPGFELPDGATGLENVHANHWSRQNPHNMVERIITDIFSRQR